MTKRPELNGFAEACYDQNTITDLIEALRGPADETDCVTWNLSSQQWRDAIADALLARVRDLTD